MAKVLKSKYNSTGERCVDACLNYGELRYINEDGSPISVEIPCDKYDEAISDFEDRIKEGLTQTDIDPKEVLKRGSVTYNQAKTIACDGRLRGLNFYDIDGSIECDHILGISGSMEYALAMWNGDNREDALIKSIVRAIKVYGEEFINGLSLDNTVDESSYLRFAKRLKEVDNMINVELYQVRNYEIDNELYVEDLDSKQKLIRNIDLPLGFIGAFIGFIVVQAVTNFGKLIDNTEIYLIINLVTMIIFALIVMKFTKVISSKYIKNSNFSIMEMFNEELEKVIYENLLTEKEVKIILKNITKGEVSKLLIDMKGSVNKKVSSNTIVTKETKFIMDARRIVILPSEYEVKQMLAKLVSTYQDKLSTDYNVKNI